TTFITVSYNTFTITLYHTLSVYLPTPTLHSFPTRRSSDLGPSSITSTAAPARRRTTGRGGSKQTRKRCAPARCSRSPRSSRRCRSEEHTSELQSRSDLVCRLLLEKKKKKK